MTILTFNSMESQLLICNKPEPVEITPLLQLTVKLLIGEETTQFKKELLLEELIKDGLVRIIPIGLLADKITLLLARMLLPLVTMLFHLDQAIFTLRTNKPIKEETFGDKLMDKTQSHTVPLMETISDMGLCKETLTLTPIMDKPLQCLI